MTPGPIQLADEIEPEYEVEAILCHSIQWGGQGRYFLIRWHSYGPENNLWLTEEELKNDPKAFSDYLSTLKDLHLVPSSGMRSCDLCCWLVALLVLAAQGSPLVCPYAVAERILGVCPPLWTGSSL